MAQKPIFQISSMCVKGHAHFFNFAADSRGMAQQTVPNTCMQPVWFGAKKCGAELEWLIVGDLIGYTPDDGKKE